MELINEPDNISCNGYHVQQVFVNMHLEHLRKWNQQLRRQLKIVTARCEFLRNKILEFEQLQHNYEILQSESILKDNEIRRLKDDNFLLEFRLQTEHESVIAATHLDRSSEFGSDVDWSDTNMRRILSQGSLNCCHADRIDDDPIRDLHDGKNLHHSRESLHRDMEDHIFEETFQESSESTEHVKGVRVQFVDHKNGMVSH